MMFTLVDSKLILKLVKEEETDSKTSSIPIQLVLISRIPDKEIVVEDSLEVINNIYHNSNKLWTNQVQSLNK